MLADWFAPTERNYFFRGLRDVDALAQKRHSTKFVECTVDVQTAILKKLETEALSRRTENSALNPFFSQMKELTLIGYFTSEIGATQELKHFVATDNYDGCIPFDEIGRPWSE